MIYFIKNLANGNFKIGYAKTPSDRFKQLQTASSEKLTLVKTIEGTQADEKKLHIRFAHLRLSGEWFSPGEELLEFISGRSSHPLIGKFFHSYESGKVQWQGQVLADAGQGYFIVETYEWAMGQIYCQRLVRLQSMEGWRFYNSSAEMRESVELGYVKT